MNAHLYLITFSNIIRGRRSTGTYELDMDRMTRSNIADDILSGQFPGVERIIELDQPQGFGGSWSDITEDIAILVRDRIVSEQHTLDYEMANWPHQVLGTDSIAWPPNNAESRADVKRELEQA